MRSLRRILVLAALALPLTASTCTTDKDVDVVVGVPTEVQVDIQSSGGQNHHNNTRAIDLKNELDLAGALDDAGVSASDVKSIAVTQIFYRIVSPQAGKQETNGHVEITRGTLNGGLFTGGTAVVVADGYGADLGTLSPDWIDITNTLKPGITVLNGLATDLLNELKNGTPAQNTAILYNVSGDVTPSSTPTLVGWKIKIVFQVVTTKSFSIPFG